MHIKNRINVYIYIYIYIYFYIYMYNDASSPEKQIRDRSSARAAV